MSPPESNGGFFRFWGHQVPVVFQAWITRVDVRNNRGRVYVFGDNMERTGYGGQAKHMRGEPNALGVPVKWSPSWAATAFFQDDDLPVIQPRLDQALNAIEQALSQGLTVVFPSAGLGTERARLKDSAPAIDRYLHARLSAMGANWPF